MNKSEPGEKPGMNMQTQRKAWAEMRAHQVNHAALLIKKSFIMFNWNPNPTIDAAVHHSKRFYSVFVEVEHT